MEKLHFEQVMVVHE